MPAPALPHHMIGYDPLGHHGGFDLYGWLYGPGPVRATTRYRLVAIVRDGGGGLQGRDRFAVAASLPGVEADGADAPGLFSVDVALAEGARRKTEELIDNGRWSERGVHRLHVQG